jgi:hypothetical protein
MSSNKEMATGLTNLVLSNLSGIIPVLFGFVDKINVF